jgi:DNA-binding NarL/FixJ family response regulator
LGAVRILIVDDFASWRRVLRRLLAVDGCIEIVGESPDGPDAIEKSSELRPDVVLLDIGLPGMSGLEAAKQISVVSPESKLLFLSASCNDAVMQEAMRIGAGFLDKTDAAQNLLLLIKAIIDQGDYAERAVLSIPGCAQ